MNADGSVIKTALTGAMMRTARNYKAMAEQDEHSRPTGRVDLYGVLADMRGKPVVRSLMSPATARRIATELLAAADQAEAQPRPLDAS